MAENELDNMSEEYKKEAAFLLERIKMRDEFAGLLKIARPEKLAELKETIARLDEVIDQTENILAMHQKKASLESRLDRDYEDLDATANIIEKELIEQVSKNNPEKLPELMEMLTGKKSH